MKIVIAGSSGLVGTALVASLTRDNHTVIRLVRVGSGAKKEGKGATPDSVQAQPSPKGSQTQSLTIDIPWNPTTCDLETAPFGNHQQVIEGADAFVNLVGASIAAESWTPERKAVLRSSRVHTTRELVCALDKTSDRPRVFVSASAIGYYGNRGDELLSEDVKPGEDFLARVSQEWEAEAVKAENLGMRVVRPRFGIILAKSGGALPVMMRPFSLGFGGALGSGRQWMSWITLEDVVQILRLALEDKRVDGAINVVAPQPARNAEFTRHLAKAMHRPAFFRVPAFALRFALGEMADSLLLSSHRVSSAHIENLGYRFAYPDLSSALAHVLQSS